jgi:hypothetical protein
MSTLLALFSQRFLRTLARSCTKCDTAEVVNVAFIGAGGAVPQPVGALPPGLAR